mmetsp:Transcript_9950/g.60841  ORF Transcript_9950/g.60841 Transcript_9950/m.60841 type:complete len:167 (-) Transcript_9950:2934-3434(-)
MAKESKGGWETTNRPMERTCRMADHERWRWERTNERTNEDGSDPGVDVAFNVALHHTTRRRGNVHRSIRTEHVHVSVGRSLRKPMEKGSQTTVETRTRYDTAHKRRNEADDGRRRRRRRRGSNRNTMQRKRNEPHGRSVQRTNARTCTRSTRLWDLEPSFERVGPI